MTLEEIKSSTAMVVNTALSFDTPLPEDKRAKVVELVMLAIENGYLRGEIAGCEKTMEVVKGVMEGKKKA